MFLLRLVFTGGNVDLIPTLLQNPMRFEDEHSHNLSDKINMNNIVVALQQGHILGKQSRDYKGGIFYSFYGVPYAKAPVGDLRFKAPQPPEPWVGTLDATVEKDGCVAKNVYTGRLEGSEDCLHLNIYAPDITRSSGFRPVMVFVHGGAFAFGNTKTDLQGPDFLLAEDVVLVTVCYRLGALGWSRLEESSLRLPGNHGTRDVIMALKWIQKNISSFCGDPDNVTLFGQSSGAAMAHFIMLSPLGIGLFHRIILHSGCILANWAVGRSDSMKRLAKFLDVDSVDDRGVLEFLKKQPVEAIFEAQRKVRGHSFGLPCERRDFFPVIEDGLNEEPPVLSQDPVSIMVEGKYNRVPMLIGYTAGEELFFQSQVETKIGDLSIDDFEDYVPHSLHLERGSAESRRVAQKVKEFYFDGTKSKEERNDKLCQLQADVFYIYPVQAAIRVHSRTMSPPIYFFKFALDGKLNLYKKFQRATLPGAAHGDDLCYLFKMSLNPEIEENSVEDLTVRRMVKLWTNFARTGNPNSEELDDVVGVKWTPVEGSKLNFLCIDRDLNTGVDPDKSRSDFWDEIYRNLSPQLRNAAYQ